MNIGIFTDTYYPQLSGVVTSIQTLTRQLEAQGHNVYIFTSTDPLVPKGTFERNVFRFSSVPFVGFKERRISYRGAIQGIVIARKLKLDIVHTQTEFSLGLMGKNVSTALRIPKIHTYHTNYEDYTHYVFNGKVLRPGAVRLLIRGFVHGMTAVVAPSKQTFETLMGYKVSSPIEIIPTGVKVNHDPSEDHSAELRADLSLDSDTPVVLVLGRVAFEKNIEAVIESFNEVLHGFPTAKLVIAGDGPALDTMKGHVASLGIENSVIFTGYVDHEKAYSYYRLADVFASASESETQGLTYIEAISADTPIVAIHNLYLDDRVTDENVGTLIDDQYELAEAISKYLAAKQANVVLGNPDARSKLLYDVDEVTFGQRIIDLYHEALAVYRDHGDDDESEAAAADAEYASSFVLKNPFRRNNNA
ncbi:MAG: glycosyltransferase [Lactobacillaceae bacterium]|jgi:1,2-diacylglycerol 3-alpha-glucosyltransferase|nr:glycosyltransferase [Lactobacillaceae bacterium]